MTFWPKACHDMLRPLKHTSWINPDTLPETTDPNLEFEYIDIGNVTLESGVIGRERMTFGNAPCRARKPVRPDDVIVSTVRTYLKAVASISSESDRWVVSTGFAVLRNKPCINPRYLYRVVQSNPFVEAVVAVSTGVSYPAINPSTLGRIPVPIPDLSTQKAIANFLDHETAHIDQLVEKKQRLVELIREREEAAFLGAVTGKDITGERIPSGVEWIGMIPAHWKAPKFTQVARQETGHTPSRKEASYWVPEECVIPWVSLADIWQVRKGDQVFISDTTEKISQIGMDNSAARLLPENTVILSRTASVGFSAIIAKPMATTQDFACWICGKNIRPKYLYYVLRAMKPEFRRLMMGSTHQTIYMPDIRAFRTPLPPLEEQDAIVQQLDTSLGRFRKVASSVEASIERLHELRAALITAAVTGQIDVESWGKRGATDRRLDRLKTYLEAPVNAPLAGSG